MATRTWKVLIALLLGVASTCFAQEPTWTGIGPGGGNVNTLAVDRFKPATLYAGTPAGGAFKSTDGGANWSAINIGLPINAEVAKIAIDPTNPTILYAGLSAGMFKSTDSGASWSEINNGLPFGLSFGVSIDALAIDPTNPSTIYVGTSQGLFKTVNSGTSWNVILNLGSACAVRAIAIHPTDASILFAGTDVCSGGAASIYKSADGGATWSPSNNGLLGSVSALAIDPVTPSTLYAGGAWVDKSTDGGASWNATGLSYTNALAIDPLTPTTIYAGETRWTDSPGVGGVYKSTNGGATWSSISAGLPNPTVNEVAINPSTPTTLYIAISLDFYYSDLTAVSEGVYKSTDGGASWGASNNGLNATAVDAVAIDSAQPTTLYAGVGDWVFKTLNDGATWSANNVFGNRAFSYIGVLALAIDPSAPTTIYAAGYSFVQKSTDGGITWSVPFNNGLDFAIVRALAIDPHTPTTVYAATSTGLYKTINGGASWSAINSGLSGSVFAIDPVTPTTLYAASSTDLFKSTDGGASWNSTGLSFGPSALAIDPRTPTTIYAAAFVSGDFGGVYKSTDGGASWSASRNGFLPYSIVFTAMAINPTTPTTVYAGGDSNTGNGLGTPGGGVFMSTDGGVSWSPITAGLTNTHVEALAVSPADPVTVYAGTDSTAAFQANVGGFRDVGGGVFVLRQGAPPPTINLITPTSGTQGQTISNFTVNGNDFQSGLKLSFSGNPADFTINSLSQTATQIVANITIASNAATGARDVIVTNSDGQHGMLLGAFAVFLPPSSNIGSSSSASSGSQTNLQVPVIEPISSGNGNYFYQHTDFTMLGRGMPLVFGRSYNTLDTYAGPLGTNWTHSYNIVLTATATGAFIKWGDGHGETFTLSGTTYLPQPGVFSTLTKNGDGTFVLTRKDQTRCNFSSSGKLTNIQDKNGNAVALTYDGTGNLIRITDTVGRSLTFTYDSTNRIIQITDPASRTVLFQYDSNNNLAQATDPAAGITAFAYDSSHRVTSITQPNGQTLLTNTYDTSGRVITQTGGRGFSTTLRYSTPGPTDTTITDARGNQTIHTYDSSLRIVKITDALGGSTVFTYDANNDRTSVTNQNGKTTNFSYDSVGNVTGITDPLSNAVAFTYDVKNDLLTATNPKGKTTTFSYDANENLRTIQDALTNTTTFGYDGFGELTSKTDARGNATTYSYDSLANLKQITDALSHSTTLAYDGIGRLTSITDPNGHAATATYDALSRLVEIMDPLSHQTQFTYDAVGNLLRITDAKGNATNYAYDATNNLASVTDALGHITRYAYDANNNRVTVTNAKGNATSYAYDALNRLSRITDPLTFATLYSYDPVGDVLSTTDAKAQTNQFTYDALNRLLNINYADAKNVAYSYDADGNRVSMVDFHGATAYAYDALDRLTSVTNPGGKVVTYAYDSVGNRKSLTYPDGKAVSYSFDPANRLSTATDWVGRNTAYTYDASSNPTGTLYPNSATLGFSYDAANRLTQVLNTYRGSAGNPVSSFTYLLDAVGNRLQITDGSGKSTNYGYDALNELTSVSVGTNATQFTYDAVGNRLNLRASGTAINYSYDADDRLLAANTSTFTYDPNGNQTSKTQASGGQPIIYAYDAANRLISVAGGIFTSGFTYDGDGNRITQTTKAGTYNYLNDVATALTVVLQESGPDGNISYAHGLGLISETSSAFTYFYQYDGLGSVVGLTDTNGKLAGRYIYDAWGQPDLSAPGPQIGTQNKFRFTGEALDPGTQLYYLRARYYDPGIGRFLNRDPVSGIAQVPTTLNAYRYALGNPLSYIDPSGAFSISIGGVKFIVSFTEFAIQADNVYKANNGPNGVSQQCGYTGADFGPSCYQAQLDRQKEEQKLNKPMLDTGLSAPGVIYSPAASGVSVPEEAKPWFAGWDIAKNWNRLVDNVKSLFQIPVAQSATLPGQQMKKGAIP